MITNGGYKQWGTYGPTKGRGEAGGGLTLIEDRNHQVRRLPGVPGQSLVDDYVSGHPEAFDQIVTRYRPFLLAVAQRRLGSAPDAEDAVQECLLRAYKGIARLDRSSPDILLSRWLMRILLNVCTDVGIRRTRQQALPAKIAALRGADGEADDVAGEAPDAWYLRSALADLPQSQREAFVLRAVDGLDYSAVAARTGVTEDNARARVHRARSNLKARLLGVQTHAGGVAAIAGATWRFRLWGVHRRLMMALTRSGAGAHGSELVSGSGAGAGTTVATIAAGLATVGGGFLAFPSSAPSPAVGHRPTVVVTAPAPSSAPPVRSSALSLTAISSASKSGVPVSPPAIVTGASRPSNRRPSGEVHAGLVVPAGLKPVPTTSSTSTSVPAAASPAPAKTSSSSSDLSWVPGAESDGSSRSSSSSSSAPSSNSSSAAPDPACQSITSMAGSGLPSSDSPSFAGLDVTQLIVSSQPAAMKNGFALFASPQSALLPSVGATSGTSVQLTADVCTVAPTQVLIADVSEPGLDTGMLQLRGTLVATTATSDSTGAYFRGTTVALSPVSGDLAALPNDFVGELACDTSTGMCDLTVAFVGQPPSDAASSPTTSTTDPTGEPSGTAESASSPSAESSALAPSQILYSVTPPVHASTKSSTTGSPLTSPNP